MDSLFNKAMVLGDLHFGRSGNSAQANQDNIDFLQWAIDDAKAKGADQCIMLGDWFDNRSSVGVGTMHSALQGLEMLSAGFRRSWFISGNHDQFHRDRRDITSIEFVRHIPNITVINDPSTVDDVTFLPWLVGDEHERLDLRGRYVFAHAEIAGFMRNSKSIMPESAHTATAEQFAGPELVFTGHFHKRQMQRNVCYIGNIFPFNFTDDGEADRGMMLLEWGHDPTFHTWPSQPLYRSIRLSELLKNIDVLKQDMTLRVTVDLSLSYEEAMDLRDTLTSGYGLRKIELHHLRDEVENVDSDVVFQTVDQLVLSSLQDIESVELSSSRLIEIYQNLI